MNKFIVTILLTSILPIITACSEPIDPVEATLAASEIKKHFKLPDDAKFKDTFIKRHKDGTVAYCGRVSLKDESGEYSSYGQAIYQPGQLSAMRSQGGIRPADYSFLWAMICG